VKLGLLSAGEANAGNEVRHAFVEEVRRQAAQEGQNALGSKPVQRRLVPDQPIVPERVHEPSLSVLPPWPYMVFYATSGRARLDRAGDYLIRVVNEQFHTHSGDANLLWTGEIVLNRLV